LAQPDATVSHEAAVLKPFLVVYFAIIWGWQHYCV
jgi:hypothetical protein